MTSIGETMNIRALDAAVQWFFEREPVFAPADDHSRAGREDCHVLDAELSSGELVRLTVGSGTSGMPLLDFGVHEHVSSKATGAGVRVNGDGEIAVHMNGGTFRVPGASVPEIMESLGRVRELVIRSGGGPVNLAVAAPRPAATPTP